MKDRYKVIISNKNLYKEIELSPEMKQVKIGTTMGSTVKLRRELFFSPIELELDRDAKGWHLSCSDNLYFTVGDVRKLLTKDLVHGDELVLKYQESDNEVMTVSFVIDFDYESKDYDLEINISDKTRLTIGGRSGCDILLKDSFLGNDYLSLDLVNGKIMISDNKSRYGVYVNGRKINRTAEIKDRDFFSIVGFSFYYKQGLLYTSSANNMVLNNLSSRQTQFQSTHFAYPKFVRNSRIEYEIPDDDLTVQNAPQKPNMKKRSILITLIPSIIMLAMIIILRGILSSSSGTYVIYSAVCMGMGIVTSIITYFTDKKDRKEQWEKRIEKYNEYIEDKKREIEDSRADELRVMNLIYTSIENDMAEAESFGRRLFEREEDDKDFLQIYLGRGTIESANQIQYSPPDFADKEDPLFDIPRQVVEDYKYIEDAPVISQFGSSDGIGITGPKAALDEMLKNITLDISIRHFYNDVKLVYILKDGDAGSVKWARWLQNVENSQLGIRNIACDEESRNVILEDLYIKLSARESVNQDGKVKFEGEHYVVFVADTEAVSTHPISKYLEKCTAYGFTFVYLAEYEEFIPQGCAEIIRLADVHNGRVVNAHNGDKITDFSFPQISQYAAREAAIKLGGITVDEVSLESELTKNITMFEMLGILSAQDLDLEKRWADSMVYKSLAAPLGVKTKNQIVSLDIGDKASAHGPHGLVAGTTGSGKSEVLQTYILSMATLYHPYEVGFVIIDFKGGGMANQFKNLPHLIGTITNIDGREINRSLLSIKAELVKRQEMFSESGVNHINDYIKLYKAGKAKTPMPHLIMIVDEFAELKAEHPDFMKELISAARIGRTLGVHLILATQKPAGVVDAQIWSNSKFRICLKVQTREDSNEVLKTPLAAEIVEAGRGYFQVGNNEIFDLFQSAYSGADVPAGNENNEKVFAVYERNLWGKKTLKYTNKTKGSEKESATQLEAIVEHVYDYCASRGIKRLPGICLPSLKDRIRADELDYEACEGQIAVPVGIFDDPEQQRQGLVAFDFSKDNMYIVGSSQMGKTVLLQTIACGLIKRYTPEQVNLYFIDCGSMVLKLFEDSAHCGGVVLSNEEEKCRNLFKLLNSMIVQRKKTLSGRSVGNYSAYLEAGYKDMPLVVVMIDNMAAFKEYFPDQADLLTSLSRESIGVGISIIITAGTSNALSYRAQANFGNRVVLNCIDPGEYSAVLSRSKLTPKEVPGRGLFMLDKRILEFQCAIFGKSDKEAFRNQEIKEYIEQRNSECTSKAVQIPMVPERLMLKDEMAKNPGAFRNCGIFPLGMDFATVEYSFIDTFAAASLTLAGDMPGRAVFAAAFMKMLAQNIIFHETEAYIIDDKNASLGFCENFGFVKEYTANTAAGLALAEEFCDDAVRRIEAEEDADEAEESGRAILVVNSLDVFRKICADKNLSRQMSETVKNIKNSGIFILFAAADNQAVGFNSSELLKTIKEERQAVFFDQLTQCRLFEVSGRIKEDPNFNETMGYRFSGTTYSRIKIFE